MTSPKCAQQRRYYHPVLQQWVILECVLEAGHKDKHVPLAPNVDSSLAWGMAESEPEQPA